jgi:hypothetical protein
MKRITYGTETFIVDDRAGADLMEHARAVASSRDPEVVEIPILQRDGSVRQAHMLIGPSTPVLAVDAPDLEPGQQGRPVAVMSRLRPVEEGEVYDETSTYFDLGFDS